MYRLRAYVCGAAVALLMAGCGVVESEPDVITLAGTWEGDTSRGDIEVTVELHLEHPAPAEVTGAGSLTENGDEASFSVVSGGYTHPTINMQWEFGDRPPISFSGTVSDDVDRIEGTLSGAGFGQDELTLHRR